MNDTPTPEPSDRIAYGAAMEIVGLSRVDQIYPIIRRAITAANAEHDEETYKANAAIQALEQGLAEARQAATVEAQLADEARAERDEARAEVERLRREVDIAQGMLAFTDDIQKDNAALRARVAELERDRERLERELHRIARLGTNQTASPTQCEAALIAMDALSQDTGTADAAKDQEK